MMTIMALLFTSITALLTLNSIRSASGISEIQKAYRLNNERTFHFKCQLPQPRAVKVEEILEDIDSGAIYSPMMVVLHRCNDAGCCQQGHHCSYYDSEDVKMVIRQEKDIGHGRKDRKYLTVEAKNHTTCKCAENDSIPK